MLDPWLFRWQCTYLKAWRLPHNIAATNSLQEWPQGISSVGPCQQENKLIACLMDNNIGTALVATVPCSTSLRHHPMAVQQMPFWKLIVCCRERLILWSWEIDWDSRLESIDNITLQGTASSFTDKLNQTIVQPRLACRTWSPSAEKKDLLTCCRKQKGLLYLVERRPSLVLKRMIYLLLYKHVHLLSQRRTYYRRRSFPGRRSSRKQDRKHFPSVVWACSSSGRENP